MNFVYLLLLVPVVLSAPVDDYVVQFRAVLTSYMSDTQTKNVLMDFMALILKNQSSQIATMSDMTVAMMKRSNQKEWTCTCTYLSQVFTGMKASMDANCKKTA
ncbi:unnamed protein product [Nippostrongylus brasiliensis]|uniref:Secreted protein n=1 Tax=Nippostrongylus brasiliensis TaxID=27835 RepID=A0A0N4Y4M4_NIPBR|nr:unnamed protein product [Nippostrongylus brasiliensis]